jgi:hypothetical protein
MTSSPVAIELTELASLPELRVGRYESLMVVVWRGVITPEIIARAAQVEADLVALEPRISVLNVITETASGTAEVALIRAAADALNRFDGAVRGSATAILATGPTAALGRAVSEGVVMLVSRLRERYRTFATVQASVEWISKLPRQDDALLSPALAGAVLRFVESSRPSVSSR